MIGQTLAHYEILEKIGAGGMGDVYVALDTTLDRKVALKILPPELAESEDRRSRFKREAKAVAALNHPNIVHVYSVEEVNGIHFITMELVKGTTLTKMLPSGGMDAKAFVELARPMVDALEGAHEEGITHRDLKPDNIMVTDKGAVKILDFGLAKLAPSGALEDVGSDVQTATMTKQGQVVGTISHMSPEQAQGKRVDHRTDIFSLGVVFYEMLTGLRPFRGDGPAAVLASVIKDTPPPVNEVNPSLPHVLGDMVTRCLEKEPDARYATAKDLGRALEEMAEQVRSGTAATGAPALEATPRQIPWGAAVAVAAVAAAGLAWFTDFGPFAPVRPSSLRLTNPIQLTSAAGVEGNPVFSPDGRMIAYQSDQSGNWDIWVVQADGGDPINRTAGSPGDDVSPAWSPDGLQLAYFSVNGSDSGIYSVGSLAGERRRLTGTLGIGATARSYPVWSRDGERLGYTRRDPEMGIVFEVRTLSSGETESFPLPGHFAFRYTPSWSPNQKLLAFVDAATWCDPAATEICDLWILNLDTEEAFQLGTNDRQAWSPSWSADSRTLYHVSNAGGSADLWQQRIASEGSLIGNPEQITSGMLLRDAVVSTMGDRLAFSRGQRSSNAWRIPILERPATWAEAEPLTRDQNFVTDVDPSSDGARAVLGISRSGNTDLYILDLASEELQRVTTHEASDRNPRWSPDDREIVFMSRRDGVAWLPWVLPLDGSPLRPLTPGATNGGMYPTWFPDGHAIVYQGSDGAYRIPSEGGERVHMETPFEFAMRPTISPDGKWLAYTGAGDGRGQRMYVQPVAGGEPRQLTDDSHWNQWSPDGSELYFRRDGQIWAVTFEGGIERPLTEFQGAPGRLRGRLGTNGRYIYFLMDENQGDVWVMDVVRE